MQVWGAEQVRAILQAKAFLDACINAGELTPEGGDNPCDVWGALDDAFPEVK